MVLIRIVFLTSLIIFVMSDCVFAGSDTTIAPSSACSSFFHVSDSAKNLTTIERIGYVCGASLGFSLFDYIGFNATKTNHSAQIAYRVLSVGVQTAITYFLYKECGLNSAIAFTLIWWTWGDDLAYYGWAYAINPKRPWEGRYYNGFQGDAISWASWTPIGLTRKKNSLIDKATLTIQAMLGFSISIAIL
jgi:hypothetical protein